MNSIKNVIETALQEDIGSGDITTDNLISPDLKGRGFIIAKEPLIIAGLEVARQVFEFLDANISFKTNYQDGDSIKKNEIVLNIEGSLRALLKGERTALNFLQRLSGIATNVREFVKKIENTKIRLLDTRKTTPGLRVLEKYAVKIGGAYNHRMGLYDGVLIKDNHIAACGSITDAVNLIRNKISHLTKIEVEVSDLAGVQEALDSKVDVIMLDNMDLKQIKQSVKLINGKALVEVSGGVKKNVLKKFAEIGVDLISAGALTHSSRAVDLSMRINK